MISRVVRAGLATGIIDGLFSSILAAFFYGSTVTRLFQGVASTVLGPDALTGGARTAAVGVLMHLAASAGSSSCWVMHRSSVCRSSH